VDRVAPFAHVSPWWVRLRLNPTSRWVFPNATNKGPEDHAARTHAGTIGGAVCERPRRTRVERDAHARVRAVAPRRAAERPVHGHGSRERRGCVGERGVQAVAGVLEDPATAVGDGGARDRVVTHERIRHRGGVLPPETGVPLDVGEEEPHRVGGSPDHVPGLSRGRATSRHLGYRATQDEGGSRADRGGRRATCNADDGPRDPTSASRSGMPHRRDDRWAINAISS
jgi:hypothetical protein